MRGIAPRSRPISAAGGAAPVPPDAFEMAWSRLLPSIRSRRVAARGSRSGCGIDAIVRAGKRAATIGRWDCCCWSTSTASSIAARIRSRASPPCWPTARPRGDDVVYVTNNSMHYRADYQTRLAAMGAPVSPDTVVSSARATAAYLRDHDPEIRRVLVLGAGGLERELRDVGYDVVTAGTAATRMSQEGIDGFAAAGQPDAVVVGLDPNLTYAAARGRRRQHPRRRAFHRHEPRPGLPDGARPAAGRRFHRHRARGGDRRRAGLDRQAGAVPARGGRARGRSRGGARRS